MKNGLRRQWSNIVYCLCLTCMFLDKRHIAMLIISQRCHTLPQRLMAGPGRLNIIQRDFSQARCLFSSVNSEPDLNNSSYLRQQDFPPFVKNLFLGKFNKSILSYAEILNEESYLNLESNVGRGGISSNCKL